MSPACSRSAHTEGRSRRSATSGSAVEAVRERTRVEKADRADANDGSSSRPRSAPPRSKRRRVDRRQRRRREVAAHFFEGARRGPCGMSSRAGTPSMSLAPNSRHDLRQLRAHAPPVRLDVLDVVEHETRQRDVAHVVVAGGRLLGRRCRGSGAQRARHLVAACQARGAGSTGLGRRIVQADDRHAESGMPRFEVRGPRRDRDGRRPRRRARLRAARASDRGRRGPGQRDELFERPRRTGTPLARSPRRPAPVASAAVGP